MEELCDDTLFGARFKDPIQYMRNRRQTEQWVREEFIAKGGDLRRLIRFQWYLEHPNGW